MTPEDINHTEDGVVQYTLTEFFRRYLTERDLERTLQMVSDEICSVGTGEDEVAMGKEAFRQLLETEFAVLPQSIPFTMTDYTQNELKPGCWDCFCNIETHVMLPNGTRTSYHMRITAGICRQPDAYYINILHASESSKYQESGEFLPLRFLAGDASHMSRETQQDLMEIIGQIMPGGIVGVYVDAELPLYIANQRMLRMAGCDCYEEFEQDIGGKFMNIVHPGDREFVKEFMASVPQLGDQYEIQYRLKKRDGTYLWVHDIGRRTLAANGQEAIISVLIDISQQVYTRTCLENEASSDPLTGVFNRKGGQNHINRQIQQTDVYLFLMMDLDNFKRVNDFYGHQEGDRALCAVAEQLMTHFRKRDVICRIGGDEFAVFVDGCTELPAMEQKLRNLIADCRELMDRQWPMAKATLSIGGIWGRKPRPFQELYRLADTVLYEVKRTRKGNHKIRILE